METLDNQRSLCPSEDRTNPLSWMDANMSVSFMGNRDGNPGTENEFTLGMHCTEKSRCSTNGVGTLVFWIREAGQSRTR
jgi:hypothetical protein